MSRTEGIYLPRLPPAHIRVGTLPVTAQSYSWLKEQTKELEKGRDDPLSALIPPEPAHKGFLGSPRYDLPPNVFSDPVMYEEVFVKELPIMRRYVYERIQCGRNRTNDVIIDIYSSWFLVNYRSHCYLKSI